MAGIALVTGLVLAGLSYTSARSSGIQYVDRLVTFAPAAGMPPPVTTLDVLRLLEGVSVFVVLAALIGVLGGALRKKRIICTYVTLAGLLTVVMAASAHYTWQRRVAVAPAVHQRVEELCNHTRYTKFAKELNCTFASAYSDDEVEPCNEFCKVRANRLRELDGCLMMDALCNHFFYEELGTRQECIHALMDASTGTMYGASLSEAGCRAECDADIRCTAYAFSEELPGAKPERCLLGQGVASLHPRPQWFAYAPRDAAGFLDGGGPISCFRRAGPVVLEVFRVAGARSSVITLALSLVLAVSTCGSCCHLYNLMMLRRGKPSAAELSVLMCCPCCAHRVHRRLRDPIFDSDSDEEASSDDDGGR